MKLTSRRVLGALLVVIVLAGASVARDSKAVDGVRTGGTNQGPSPARLSSTSVDFETPELFSDTLPLQVFQSLQTTAIFRGTGAVLDVASFEVTGATGKSALAFNGRTAVNGDGTIPQLPEWILFVAPDGRAASPKQTVSVDVGSKRDAGRFAVLLALNRRLNVVDLDAVQVSPQMQTLTVSSVIPDIVVVALFGEAELKILVADNLTYN